MKLLKTLLIGCAVFLTSTSIAQFSFVPSTTNGCAPLPINITNTSSAGAHYDWDFGDGTFISDVTNPSHTYLNGGNYWITMWAYDATYSFIGQTDVQIQVSGAPQGINMDSYTICPNDLVWLNVYVPGNNSYSWNFGDGNTSSGYDYVEHAYASPGTYYPEVTITTSCGTYVVQDTVVVTNSIPFFGGNPYMSVNPLAVCPGSEVYGYTQDNYSAYSWDFGNGGSSSDHNPDWTYASNGNYLVQLTITNGCGVDTILTENVAVSNATPVQNSQTSVPDTVCPGEFFFADSWADDGVSFSWDMGDGSPLITNQSAYYAYATPGTYTATVTITNDCGNTDVLSEVVVVTNSAPVNNPNLYISSNSVCPGDEVYFSANYEYDYYIDYGDGDGSDTYGYHSYDTPGNYVITATIQNACGNSVVLTDTITVQSNLAVDPNMVYPYAYPSPACPGTEIEMSANYGYQTYSWDFGDGGTSTNEQPGYIYNTPGNYTVTLVVTNGCGNQATVTTSVSIQSNLLIQDVNFDISADTICPGDAVFFDADNDDGSIGTYWDLGDGTTTTNFAVSHSYATVGVYPIELTVTNGCGNDSTVFDAVVVSNSYIPSPGDYQAFAQDEGCVGDQLYFVLIPAGAGNITWDFGDGNSTNQVDQVLVQGVTEVDVAFHAYNAIGQYWAKYTITNSCGNSLTDSILIDVGTYGDQQSMDVSFWWDETQTACQGQPVEFMAVGGAQYIWDFGDGTGQLLTNSSLTPVFHTYADPGSYTVTVNSVNNCGNTDDSDEQIYIPQSQMNVSTNTVTEPNCGNNNGLAIVSVTGGMAPYSYSWTNGDTGVIADSLSSGVYVVTVTDNNDCSNEGIATVSDQEGVVILVDNVVDVDCYGAANGSISVSILGGQPPYTILWSNGDQTEDIFGLQAGPYEIFVTDANGCFSVESIHVSQPLKSNVSVITTKATCGFNDGTATASVNNGTGPFNYIWPNTTGPNNTTGGLAPGIHTLLVIDGNTCLLQKDFAINEIGGPVIVTDSTEFGTCNGTLSSIYISTIGGQGPFTYNWSNGSTNQDLVGVVPGTYIVQAQSATGCSSYRTYTVAESQPEKPTICMVDVDTLTGTNLVVWDPITAAGIESYNIYKESSEAGLYYLIGNSSADSLSQYHDYLSDPGIRSWRYKISSLDDCGNESELSDYHKTMHLTSNKGVAGEYNLIWDHYQGFSYSTYYINRWHPTTGWEIIDSVSSNAISYSDYNAPGDSNLVYMISINTPGLCTAAKATDYNSSRSNKNSNNMAPPNGSGINELQVDLTIYPNPSNGIVTIRYEKGISAIKLYDMAGNLVLFDENVGSNKFSFDLSQYESGIYNVQIMSGDDLLNGKIVKH